MRAFRGRSLCKFGADIPPRILAQAGAKRWPPPFSKPAPGGFIRRQSSHATLSLGLNRFMPCTELGAWGGEHRTRRCHPLVAGSGGSLRVCLFPLAEGAQLPPNRRNRNSGTCAPMPIIGPSSFDPGPALACAPCAFTDPRRGVFRRGCARRACGSAFGGASCAATGRKNGSRFVAALSPAARCPFSASPWPFSALGRGPAA